MNPKPLLAGRNLSVRFGDVVAVADASVEVQPGEAIGVVGESGSGKTTLARVLAGLLRPAVGEVLLDGEPVFGAHSRAEYPHSERWKVQMVFQDPYSSLNPRQRAWQAVAEAVQVWRHLARSSARIEALALLHSMGISPDQAAQFPGALSGGQRQRVSVARGLAPRPRVLIADEPTSAIDQSAQAQLLNILRALQRERDLAVIFISHDLGIIRYLTSRVYVMQSGQIVESGDTAAVFNSPHHPYTRLLLDSIPGRRVVKA
jgi:peptide/nickel transport system ATP-binding protein